MDVSFGPPSKIDLRYTEHTLIFTICDCSLDKKYSFYGLTRQQSETFIARLKHFEKLSWSQIASLDRKNGLTAEKVGGESYDMIDYQNSCDDILEKFYFHLRIEQTGLFRIFGYQKERFFCITHIDRDGKIHH